MPERQIEEHNVSPEEQRLEIVSIQLEPDSILPGELGREFGALGAKEDRSKWQWPFFMNGRFGYINPQDRSGYLYITAGGRKGTKNLLLIT